MLEDNKREIEIFDGFMLFQLSHSLLREILFLLSKSYIFFCGCEHKIQFKSCNCT